MQRTIERRFESCRKWAHFIYYLFLPEWQIFSFVVTFVVDVGVDIVVVVVVVVGVVADKVRMK